VQCDGLNQYHVLLEMREDIGSDRRSSMVSFRIDLGNGRYGDPSVLKHQNGDYHHLKTWLD